MAKQTDKDYLDGDELRKWAAQLYVQANDPVTAGEERSHLLSKSALKLAKDTDRDEGKGKTSPPESK